MLLPASPNLLVNLTNFCTHRIATYQETSQRDTFQLSQHSSSLPHSHSENIVGASNHCSCSSRRLGAPSVFAIATAEAAQQPPPPPPRPRTYCRSNRRRQSCTTLHISAPSERLLQSEKRTEQRQQPSSIEASHPHFSRPFGSRWSLFSLSLHISSRDPACTQSWQEAQDLPLACNVCTTTIHLDWNGIPKNEGIRSLTHPHRASTMARIPPRPHAAHRSRHHITVAAARRMKRSRRCTPLARHTCCVYGAEHASLAVPFLGHVAFESIVLRSEVSSSRLGISSDLPALDAPTLGRAKRIAAPSVPSNASRGIFVRIAASKNESRQ